MLTSNPVKYIVFPILVGLVATLIFGGWGILLGPAFTAGVLMYLDREELFGKEDEVNDN